MNMMAQLIGMAYLDFDLKLSSTASADYQVEVLGSPSVRSNPVRLHLPEAALAAWQAQIKNGKPDKQLTHTLGRHLFEAVFQPEVLKVWQASQQGARTGETMRLRLDIRAPALTAVPWEIMHDGTCYLALTTQLPLLRYAYDQPVLSAVEDRRPLNILLLVSTPSDVPPLPDIERELQLISDSVQSLQSDGRVGQLDIVRHVTRQVLQQQLRQKEYQVLHYMGHGTFSADNGYLIFEDEHGRAEWVDGETLSYFFRTSPLRLLFLNSCQTSIPSQTDSLLGAAQAALVAGVPAVVAMQATILDESAATFAHQFYQSLVEARPLEFCMVQGRLALMNSAHADWAIPVLFSNVSDGLLWRGTEHKAGETWGTQWTVIANGNDNMIGHHNEKTVINYLPAPPTKKRRPKS
jgi:CHAT domain